MTDNIKYNPMSKEFQNEAKRLGLTGRQLTEKYRKEGKSIEKEKVFGCRSGNYNLTNTCQKIKRDGSICGSILIPHTNARREHDKEGNETGRWICEKCRSADHYKYGVGSVANWRTGNRNPNHNIVKGDNFEELTSIWKTVKVLSKLNGHNGPLDHSADSNGIIYQTKGKFYDSINKHWNQSVKNEWNKKYDYLIFYCASEDGKDIERIYEFPEDEIMARLGVKIRNKPYGYIDIGWYEKYRVTDENEIKRANDIWKEIIGEN